MLSAGSETRARPAIKSDSRASAPTPRFSFLASATSSSRSTKPSSTRLLNAYFFDTFGSTPRGTISPCAAKYSLASTQYPSKETAQSRASLADGPLLPARNSTAKATMMRNAMPATTTFPIPVRKRLSMGLALGAADITPQRAKPGMRRTTGQRPGSRQRARSWLAVFSSAKA
jgi:hypothetical protein